MTRLRASAGAILSGALLAACGGGSQPAPPAHGSAVTIRTGVNPAGIAVAGGYAWVANAGEGTLSKIDAGTNRIVSTVKVGDPHGLVGCATGSIHQTPHGSFTIRDCDLPKAVAISKGAVWAGRGDTRSIVRVDPVTDRVVATIAVGIEPWYIAASDTAVWASDWRTDTVVRVDPAANRVLARITGLPHGPTGIAIAPGSVWVACSRASALVRIDSATNQVVATLPTDLTPLPVAYAFGSVWVRSEFREGDGTVTRIDPATNRTLASIPVGPEAGRDGLDGLAVLDGGLWVSGLTLERIDPDRNQVVAHNSHTSNAVTAGADSLWTVDIAYSVTRITP